MAKMLVVIGAAESLQVSSLVLISGRRSVKGWYPGTAIDSQDTLKFSVLTGVRSRNRCIRSKKARRLMSDDEPQGEVPRGAYDRAIREKSEN